MSSIFVWIVDFNIRWVGFHLKESPSFHFHRDL